MWRRPSAGLPIFWQTMLMLLGTLVLVQLVAMAMLMVFPPPRPDFSRLSDIADALTGERPDPATRERELVREDTTVPPPVFPAWSVNPVFTERLAKRIGVTPERVFLQFRPDQHGSPFFSRRHRDRMIPYRHGEPVFFSEFVAGLDTGHGWTVVKTPPSPLIAPWQRRLILWYAACAILVTPLAWFFARRLTRPMRNMADAADRLGTDYNAPQVAIEGPRELRTTAVALNRMQGRISDHVAERTAMIGAIAHDLRTPLARIAFRIESAPPAIREKIQADIQQMQTMISDTIGFVRNVSEHRERLPVELCDLIAALVQKERETGHEVKIEANEPASIFGEPIALSRLFQNLIDNAISYGERARLGVVVEGELVTVTISDDGPGLDEAQIGRMLLPFERGDRSRNRSTGGTGLGLAIAKAIVEDHGGSISLVNRAGRSGLDVRCVFPIVGS